MVARGAGDVGCAHCTQFGANQTCRVCKLQVCDACATDWRTCHEPAGREVRLGMGWRLRDVDPKGRLAFVTHILKAPRLVDLRRLQWLGHAPLGLNLYAALKNSPPRLTSDGLLVHAEMSLVNSDTAYVDGVRWHTLEGEQVSMHLNNVEGPHGPTVVSASDDVLAYVTDSQRVIVMRHAPVHTPATPAAAALVGHPRFLPPRDSMPYHFVTQTCEPLPRKVISAIDIDGERDLLASATWREVAIHRTHAGVVERYAYVDTQLDANITWVGLTGRWLAYATSSRLEVRPIEALGSVGEVKYKHSGSFKAIAIARDGSYLAFNRGSDLVVHDLDRDTQTEFTEHSDGINYIRFAADDHTLISGDKDNRIVMRPRTEDGYAKPIVRVELSGEP